MSAPAIAVADRPEVPVREPRLARPDVVASRLRAWRLAVVVLCVYAVVALALFPNVATHLTNAFPADLGDPPSQAWVLAWDVHALMTDPAHLYEGNIFYPSHDTLAYQDTGLSLLPVAAPIILLTGNALLAYNVLFLLSFALCAWGAYLLAHFLVRDGRAAFLAGLIYGFSPYRMVHLSHLNLLCSMWVPLTLLCWERARRGRRRYWVGAGIFFACQALSALYYAAFLAVCLALLSLIHLYQAARSRPGEEPFVSPREYMGYAILATLGTGLALLPFLVPYVRVGHSVDGLGQAVYYAADLRDFLHSAALNVLYGWTGPALGIRPDDPMQYLWPGIATIALGAWGLRSRARALTASQQAYVLLGVATAILCLGPVLKVWGHQTGLPLPYLLLYKVPGFGGWRDPARFGAIYTLCLAVLAAYGVAALLRVPRLLRWGRAGLIIFALCIVVLAESWLGPLPAAPLATGAAMPPVYRWLAARPDRAPVLELPTGLTDRAVWAYQTETMYYSTYHWHPIATGIGRFAPPDYAPHAQTYNTFPSPAALRLLRARHIRYVIVHPAWLGERAAASIRARAAHVAGVQLIKRWTGPTGADAYVVP